MDAYIYIYGVLVILSLGIAMAYWATDYTPKPSSPAVRFWVQLVGNLLVLPVYGRAAGWW